MLSFRSLLLSKLKIPSDVTCFFQNPNVRSSTHPTYVSCYYFYRVVHSVERSRYLLRGSVPQTAFPSLCFLPVRYTEDTLRVTKGVVFIVQFMNNHRVGGDDKMTQSIFEISHPVPLEVFNLDFAFLGATVGFLRLY